ncbi:hypothetical protein [Rosenbergiella metrosideri]|uniref:hypothetical protein n=1 Tax=Rosenbergiella metrosideri TaxID=2921185 RepID=UPI001F4F58F9|nr:hypothetical protein [Rosenbergiella metrosideri]
MKLSSRFIVFFIFIFTANAHAVCNVSDETNIYIASSPTDDKEAFSTSDILASAAIIISIITILISIYTNRESNKRSVLDMYWMREVIIPSFLDPFILFHLNALNEYKRSSSNGDFYMNFALSKINEIRNRSRVISISDNNLRDKVVEIIEEFEDSIYSVASAVEFEDLLDSFSMKVVKEIQASQIK